MSSSPCSSPWPPPSWASGSSPGRAPSSQTRSRRPASPRRPPPPRRRRCARRPRPAACTPAWSTRSSRRRAAAADAGHELTITSGFRTAEEQAAMLEAEIAKRGSPWEALRWVFPPDRSMHVQGLAIDVGDGPAADWLARRGRRASASAGHWIGSGGTSSGGSGGKPSAPAPHRRGRPTTLPERDPRRLRYTSPWSTSSAPATPPMLTPSPPRPSPPPRRTGPALALLPRPVGGGWR